MLFRIKREKILEEDKQILEMWADYGKKKGWGEPISKEFYIQRFMGWYPIGFWISVRSNRFVYNTEGFGDIARQEIGLYFEAPKEALEYIRKKFPGASVIDVDGSRRISLASS